jgi:hypothetical protein
LREFLLPQMRLSQSVCDFVCGVVFAGLYPRTGNPFLVIGIHALQNAGATVVAPSIDPSTLIFLLAVIVLLAGLVPPIGRRLRGIYASPSPGRASVLTPSDESRHLMLGARLHRPL